MSRRSGFSVVEVLVTFGLIGILVGLLLAAVQSARASASRVSCANNVRQIALACHQFHVSHSMLPPQEKFVPRIGGPGGRQVLLWTVLLLPFLEQGRLWSNALEDYAITYGYHVPPHRGLSVVVKLYTCQSDGRLTRPITDDRGYTVAYGSYMGVSGEFGNLGAFDGDPRNGIGVEFRQISDGLSNTLLLGERPPPGRYMSGSWYTNDVPDVSWLDQYDSYMTHLPIYQDAIPGPCRGPFKFGPGRLDNPCDSHHFWSLHPGGANFALADGSVRFLAYSTNNSMMRALATRAGGETVSLSE